MKILITGGAGFIGSNISKKLSELNHEVVIFDNFLTGFRENLKNLNVAIVEGDITNYAEIDEAIRIHQPQAICHQAALPSVPRSIDEPLISHRNNIEGSLNVLEAARQNKVRRFIYAGSSSFYGDVNEQVKRENLPFNPLSPYSLQKGVGEYYCHLYHKFYGLETMCLRYFNVFGPNQNPNSTYAAVIPLFIKKIINNEPPTINGDGNHSRDFTYIDNVVDGNIRALTHKLPQYGRTVNCATGNNVTLNELVGNINKILNKKIEPIYGPERIGDILHSQADISEAKKVLGFRVIVSFEEGLQKTIEWYKEFMKK